MTHGTAVLLGLAAALGWGVGDLFARFSARSVGPVRAMFYGHMPGVVLLSAWLVANPDARFAAAGWDGWFYGLLSAACCICATYALLRAVAIGRLVVVSPLMASYAAITAALSIVTGETVANPILAGMALAVAGVALTAAGPEHRHKAHGTQAGIGWALAAAVAYGVGLWLQGAFAVPRIGSVAPVWMYYVGAVLANGVLARMHGLSLAFPPLPACRTVFGGGTLAAAAFLACSMGFAGGQIGVVAVLSSLSAGITALLGALVLGERLAAWQWGGVAAILGGIVLIRVA